MGGDVQDATPGSGRRRRTKREAIAAAALAAAVAVTDPSWPGEARRAVADRVALLVDGRTPVTVTGFTVEEMMIGDPRQVWTTVDAWTAGDPTPVVTPEPDHDLRKVALRLSWATPPAQDAAMSWTVYLIDRNMNRLLKVASVSRVGFTFDGSEDDYDPVVSRGSNQDDTVAASRFEWLSALRPVRNDDGSYTDVGIAASVTAAPLDGTLVLSAGLHAFDGDTGVQDIDDVLVAVVGWDRDDRIVWGQTVPVLTTARSRPTQSPQSRPTQSPQSRPTPSVTAASGTAGAGTQNG